MPQPPLCFETIRVEQRQLHNLSYHEARLNRTRAEVWSARSPLSLRPQLTIPEWVGTEKYKCRITYGAELVTIEWERYLPRTIQSLRLVQADEIRYAYKYKNRQPLEELYARRQECDDVLIVKKGLITDSSYANVAFFDGTYWQTPAEPLLPGTQRAFLLETGVLLSQEIRVEELKQFTQVRLFNAMIPWEESTSIPIGRIVGY